MKKANIIFLLILATSFTVFAQKKAKILPTFTVKSGKNEQPPDSIQVMYFKGILNAGFENRENLKVRKAADNSSVFTINTTQKYSPFVLIVWYPTDRNRVKREAFESRTYYAEPTDDIEIRVKKGSIVDNMKINGSLEFIGKGAEKYKVVDILGQMKNELISKEVENLVRIFGGDTMESTGKIESNNFYKTNDFNDALNSLYVNVKKGMQKSSDTLEKYKKSLGPELIDLYRNEFVTNIAFVNLTHWLYGRAKTPETKDAIANFYFSKIDDLALVEPKGMGYDLGMAYTWGQGVQLMNELNYKTKGNGFPLELQYSALKRIKNTNLKEILITNFFEQGTTYQTYINNVDSRDSCLRDALNFITQPELRKALEYQQLFAKGASMPEFSFPDTSGNITNLKDMKGKVYMLDFYFEGCSSCIAFSKRFESEIYPHFANDDNFKVLSVNTDANRKMWIRAIQSGNYTHPSSINLSTGAAGYKHPILTHYGINAFPWVLLIDKNGRVITFKTPELSSPTIIQLIKEALAD